MEGQTMSEALALVTAIPSIQNFDLKVGFSEADTKRMLISAVDQNCSDIKIQSGDYVTVYWKRQWHVLTTRILEDTEATKILTNLAGPSAISIIGNAEEVDTDPEFFRDGTREMVRFRMNAIRSRVGGTKNGVTITLRSIPPDLPNLCDQGLPDALAEELLPQRGTVLVSGATGSGKTTLIAALLHERSKEKPAPCIITYEDPPEFQYGSAGLGRGPLVAQAHIGTHLKSWSRAGPTAMRRKADIILMGEVRDPETAEYTMEMGITGHGVYATIHADTPQETIFRLVEMFPEGARSAAAAKMLSSLRVICSQKLVKLDAGRIVALRAWIIFDSAIKDDLQSPEWPYPTWARYVRDYIKAKKQDFASQSIPYIQTGEMGLKLFREITQMGRDEAQEYFALQGREG